MHSYVNVSVELKPKIHKPLILQLSMYFIVCILYLFFTELPDPGQSHGGFEACVPDGFTHHRA